MDQRQRVKKAAPLIRYARKLPLPPLLDPGNDPDHPSSLALRVVRRMPKMVVEAPERVVINVAMILVGLSAFIADEPGSVLHSWYEWAAIAFGLCMIGGGISVLVGMLRPRRTVERLGYVLLFPSCIAYGVGAFWVRGVAGLPVLLIFLGLAFAKIIRLIISSAERDATIEFGKKLDRDAGQEDS